MTSRLYLLEPEGITGGRVYLQMVHEALSPHFPLSTLVDHKRTGGPRRNRRLQHLWRTARSLPWFDPGAFFVWDDFSLWLFRKAMRRRTIFILHHYDPTIFRTWQEEWLWEKTLRALADCFEVVCVSPYWQTFLAERGIRSRVIYNAYDVNLIDMINQVSKSDLKAKFNFPPHKPVVYVGRVKHNVELRKLTELIDQHPQYHFVTTGNKAVLNALMPNTSLSYSEYLQFLRACDVAVFPSTVLEGWGRCATEAILVQVPTLLNPVAGMKQLAELARQPFLDWNCLSTQIQEQLETPLETRLAAYTQVAQFNQAYFQQQWVGLFNELHSSQT